MSLVNRRWHANNNKLSLPNLLRVICRHDFALACLDIPLKLLIHNMAYAFDCLLDYFRIFLKAYNLVAFLRAQACERQADIAKADNCNSFHSIEKRLSIYILFATF